jgi:hypothetical protein
MWELPARLLRTIKGICGEHSREHSITLNTGTSLSGSTLAQNGAVTLDSNTVSIAQCNATFVAPPTIAKAFGAATIGVGGTTTLSFTINNPNATLMLNGVAFTDTLPASLIVSSPNGLTRSRGGGNITAVAGSGSVSLAGATLAGGRLLYLYLLGQRDRDNYGRTKQQRYSDIHEWRYR